MGADEFPAHGEYAGPEDTLSWETHLDGRMVDYATTPEGEPVTAPLTLDDLPEEVARALHDADRS